MRPRFITFEGIDGAGKSTHVPWFADRLRARDIEVVVTREPGGAALAERLRELILHEKMQFDTETLLIFAARLVHLQGVVRPALATGRWVLCDRFTDSTYAYQGGGRGMAAERIAVLESWTHGDLQPDRTYLFDLPADEAERRRGAVRAADRFEMEDLGFFERVRAAYLDRCQREPGRFVAIDARRSVDDIQKLLDEDIANLCSKED